MKKIAVLFTLVMVLAVMSSFMFPCYADTEAVTDEESDVVTDTSSDSDSVVDTTDPATSEPTTVDPVVPETEADAGIVNHGDHTHAADDMAHDHDGDGEPDHAAADHKDPVTWNKLGTSGIIAVAVAAVIAVAAVTAIILLAPKKSKHK